jgi:hypothetical protein
VKFKNRIIYIKDQKDFLTLTPHETVILCGYLCSITPGYIKIRPEWDDTASTNVYSEICKDSIDPDDPMHVLAKSIVGITYRPVRASHSKKSRIRSKAYESTISSNVLFCHIIKWILASKVRVAFIRTCKKTAEAQL